MQHSEALRVADTCICIFIAWWIWGIFTTFFRGSIPIVGWNTHHNIILGLLWLAVLGPGAGVPIAMFRNLCGIVGIGRHGIMLMALLILTTVFQIYVAVLLITAWFPQALPLPVVPLSGGLWSGLVVLVFALIVIFVGNITRGKLLMLSVGEKATEDDDTEQ